MIKNLKIGRVAGTDVKLHITFLLFIAWIAVAHYVRGGYTAAVEGVTFLLSLFGCVLLHEFGHVFAARMFGVRTPEITLLPIGGLARLEKMPDKPWQELIVALAGPAVTFLLFLGFAAYAGSGLKMLDETVFTRPESSLVAKLAAVNLLILIFNLIPAFPMDGGRVLRSLLAFVLPFSSATRIAALLGQVIAVIFGFVGLFYNPLLVFIAFIIYMGASQEVAMAEMKDLTAGLKVSDAMVTDFRTISMNSTLEEAVQALLHSSQNDFPIVDENGNAVGILSRGQIMAALKLKNLELPMILVSKEKAPAVQAESSLTEAVNTLQNSSCRALPVTEAGKVTGLLTVENIRELLMVRSALAKG